MAFKKFNFAKKMKVLVPLIFCSGMIGVGVGFGISNAIEVNKRAKINEYAETLKASGEVGNIDTQCVLPFGDRQIVLTVDYTNAAKSVLSPEEYPLFLRSFYEPLNEINNLKVGYNFTLTSEDGSFGLPTPKANVPSVEWIASSDLGDTTVGQWYYSKNAFSENYYYMQDPSTLNQISLPVGLETYISEDNIDNLNNITVYGNQYPTARILTNYKIVKHEIFHSIGVGHITSSMNVPKNEGGVLESYMTTSINYNYVGDSTFDNNTLIAASCLRKILSGSQNTNDKYFDPAHYTTFNTFMEMGRENLNNSNQKGE